MKKRSWNTSTALALASALGIMSVISPSAALLLAPALLLLLVLSLGYFPGETVIERIRGRRAQTRSAVLPAVEKLPATLDLAKRAGLKIAYALAVRPPPRFSIRHG